MNQDRFAHLSEERIIAAIVDERDLTHGERMHLQQCPACAAARALLADRLDAFSEDAGRFTPAPRRRVVIPEEAPVNPLAWVLRWSTGIAAVVATVAVVLAFLLVQVFPGATTPAGLPAGFAQEMAQDAKLMADVTRLVDDPLPANYGDILPENDMGSEDDGII